MKQKLLLRMLLLLIALIAGTGSMWADTKEKEWDLTSSSSDWAQSGCETYFGQPYGIKKANAYIINKAIDDFSISGITSIKISVKSLYNGTTASKLTVYLVDKDGNTIGSGQEITPVKASSANSTTYKDVTFTSNFTGVTGMKVECTTFGKNVLINGVKYVVTYVPTPDFEITAHSNDDVLGTVSLLGMTITATPKEGCRVSNANPYTVSPAGSATVVRDDNEFTVTPTAATTITINFEAIPTHAVVCNASPAEAGVVEAVSASVREGETTSISATANAGYKFAGWSVTGTGASLSSTETNPTTLTMGTADATVTANFTAVTTYPVHWSVNGEVVRTDNVEENTAINFAAPASGVPEGYVFKGWVEDANRIDTPTDSDPSANYVTSASCTTEITYYAVMAVDIDNTTKEKVTITVDTENIPTSYGTAKTFTEYTFDGKKFKVQQMYLNNGALQWRADGNDNGTGTMYNTEALGYIQNIILTYSSGNTQKNFTVKVGDTENPTSGTAITPTIDDSEDVYTFDCSSLKKSYFVLTNGTGAGYLSSIVINFKEGEIYTYNYCTTVPTATIAINEACTDGANYYATYSNSKAFVVPEGLTVSAISVADSKLTKMDYETGDIVPANTGVLVAATTSGEHSVTLAAGGTAKAGNMLKASGDSGITAADMAEADTEFFRLTMHNGTDVGFWWGAADGASFAIEGHKAYLAVPKANIASVRGFSLTGDETDGIADMRDGAHESVSNAIFDLSGRRVVKPARGLYIVNGKKFVK